MFAPIWRKLILLQVSALDPGPKGGAPTDSYSHFIYDASIPTHALSFQLNASLLPCLLAFLPPCLPPCLLSCLLAFLLAFLPPCLPPCLLACFLACLLASLPATPFPHPTLLSLIALFGSFYKAWIKKVHGQTDRQTDRDPRFPILGLLLEPKTQVC